MVFIRFERGRDCIVGPTYGPYEFVQITYNLIRGILGSEETNLATHDGTFDDWILIDVAKGEEIVFSDVIIYQGEGDTQ